MSVKFFTKKIYSIKRAFTLLEILIVVLLIWILISATSKFYNPWNKNRFYSQICINKVYWSIRNFVNSAVFGKWISYSWQFYYPEDYKIIFDYTGNKIDFQIWLQTWDLQVQTIFLTWNKRIKECQDITYYINFTWNIDQIVINKNLQEIWSKKWFSIIPNMFTWKVDFFINEYWLSRKISQLIADQRSQEVFNNQCLSLPADPHQKCTQWSR